MKLFLALAAMLLAVPVFAETPDPKPLAVRVSEVERRLDRIEKMLGVLVEPVAVATAPVATYSTTTTCTGPGCVTPARTGWYPGKLLGR